VAVAATYLAGFRTSLGVADLTEPFDPTEPSGNLEWALAEHPASAAAAVWHADRSEHTMIKSTLASEAAVHQDAHVAKYTLACFDAAESDPAEARTYLSAAAHLLAVWIEHPVDIST